MSIVRDNLLNVEGYTPYCGNQTCPTMPRTVFNGTQFECPTCEWKSSFELAFIKRYLERQPAEPNITLEHISERYG